METKKILLDYAISDICDVVLDYAFKHKVKKDHFSLGNYEKCVDILVEISSIDIQQYLVQILLEALLGYAYCGEHIKIANLVIHKLENLDVLYEGFGVNRTLYDICCAGNMEIAKLLIELGADCNEGLVGACYGGYIEIVELMIEKGADKWDDGFEKACSGGHMEIVEFMIEKGATDWVRGLTGANSGNMEIIKLIINKLENSNLSDLSDMSFYWNKGLCEACRGGSPGRTACARGRRARPGPCRPA